MKHNLANVEADEVASEMKPNNRLALYDNGEIEVLRENEGAFGLAITFSYGDIMGQAWLEPENETEAKEAIALFVENLQDNWQVWF